MSFKDRIINFKNIMYGGSDNIGSQFANVRNNILSKLKNTDRENFIQFVFSKYGLFLCIFIIILIWIYYFYFWSKVMRVPRLLKKLDNLENLVNPKPFSSCNINLSKYKLCDFYVASSSKSYLIGQQTNDYVSSNMITKVIKGGARFIELDIFNETFDEFTEPIVANGIEKGRYIETYNYETFDNCCKTLSECAFSRLLIENSDDPLFLYLNLHVNGNLNTLNRVSEIIINYFRDKLLPSKYGYQKIKIPQENINVFFGKLIIFASPGFKNSKLDEIVNFSPSAYYMRKYSYDDVENSYEPTEITNFNKQNISIVDANDYNSSINKSPLIPWKYGCQFVGINYQSEDAGLFEYLNKFNEYSFKLKPKPLRYKPLTYNAPKKQDKKVSFATMNIKTPMYNAKI